MFCTVTTHQEQPSYFTSCLQGILPLLIYSICSSVAVKQLVWKYLTSIIASHFYAKAVVKGANDRIEKLKSKKKLSKKTRAFNVPIAEKDFWIVLGMRLELINAPAKTLSAYATEHDKYASL